MRRHQREIRSPPVDIGGALRTPGVHPPAGRARGETGAGHYGSRDTGRGPARPEERPLSDYAKALGARLRAIRSQQGLSLHGVEEKSRGRWKAVVVGSYERGDRAVTVQRLAELADFYGVPVAELLPAK